MYIYIYIYPYIQQSKELYYQDYIYTLHYHIVRDMPLTNPNAQLCEILCDYDYAIQYWNRI